jgi:hypothetical protein
LDALTKFAGIQKLSWVIDKLKACAELPTLLDPIKGLPSLRKLHVVSDKAGKLRPVGILDY